MTPAHPFLSQQALDSFSRNGFLLLKRAFSPIEISRLRLAVVEAMEEQRERGLEIRGASSVGSLRATTSDVLSIGPLRPIALDRRVVGPVTALLGEPPLYFGYSSARIGGHGGTRSWHRDALPASGEPTRLVRAAIYLQDHALHSGGLAIKPRTHVLSRFVWPLVPSVLLPIERGDLLIWDMRTYHAGEVVRLRAMPTFPTPARLAGHVPSSVTIEEEAERMVIFLAFGGPGGQFDPYMESLRARDYMQDKWANSPLPSEVLDEAREAGLRIFRPVPHYGAVDPSTSRAIPR